VAMYSKLYTLNSSNGLKGTRADLKEDLTRIWESITNEASYTACVRTPTTIRGEVHSFFLWKLCMLYD